MATEWKARMRGSLKYYMVGSWIFAAVMGVLWLWLRFDPESGRHGLASLGVLIAVLPIAAVTVVVYKKARFWINIALVGVVGLVVGTLLGAVCGFLVELYWVIAGGYDESAVEVAVRLLPTAGAASGAPIAAAAWLVKWQQREKKANGLAEASLGRR